MSTDYGLTCGVLEVRSGTMSGLGRRPWICMGDEGAVLDSCCMTSHGFNNEREHTDISY